MVRQRVPYNVLNLLPDLWGSSLHCILLAQVMHLMHVFEGDSSASPLKLLVSRMIDSSLELSRSCSWASPASDIVDAVGIKLSAWSRGSVECVFSAIFL